MVFAEKLVLPHLLSLGSKPYWNSLLGSAAPSRAHCLLLRVPLVRNLATDRSRVGCGGKRGWDLVAAPHTSGYLPGSPSPLSLRLFSAFSFRDVLSHAENFTPFLSPQSQLCPWLTGHIYLRGASQGSCPIKRSLLKTFGSSFF